MFATASVPDSMGLELSLELLLLTLLGNPCLMGTTGMLVRAARVEPPDGEHAIWDDQNIGAGRAGVTGRPTSKQLETPCLLTPNVPDFYRVVHVK